MTFWIFLLGVLATVFLTWLIVLGSEALNVLETLERAMSPTILENACHAERFVRRDHVWWGDQSLLYTRMYGGPPVHPRMYGGGIRASCTPPDGVQQRQITHHFGGGKESHSRTGVRGSREESGNCLDQFQQCGEVLGLNYGTGDRLDIMSGTPASCNHGEGCHGSARFPSSTEN